MGRASHREALLRSFTVAAAAAAAVVLAGPAATPAAAQSTVSGPPPAGLAKATFAGGCFWCMEPPFESLPGVVSVTSGYTGGTRRNPTYQEVSSGGTGHTEAVEIVFDPEKVSYRRLLEVFWVNVDPTTPNRQFCDIGEQYRTGIFVHDEEQRRLAEESKAELARAKRFKEPVVTEIAPAREFYVAEEYHQDYAKKNPLRYRFYRYNCGRDERLHELWGDAAPHH
jgi:peptide-methionine (S)-S-oxide reductase